MLKIQKIILCFLSVSVAIDSDSRLWRHVLNCSVAKNIRFCSVELSMCSSNLSTQYGHSSIYRYVVFLAVLDSGKCLKTIFFECDVSDKVVKIFKTHICLSLSLSLSSKNPAIDEIIFKNIVQLDRSQITVWRMCFA